MLRFPTQCLHLRITFRAAAPMRRLPHLLLHWQLGLRVLQRELWVLLRGLLVQLVLWVMPKHHWVRWLPQVGILPLRALQRMFVGGCCEGISFNQGQENRFHKLEAVNFPQPLMTKGVHCTDTFIWNGLERLTKKIPAQLRNVLGTMCVCQRAQPRYLLQQTLHN